MTDEFQVIKQRIIEYKEHKAAMEQMGLAQREELSQKLQALSISATSQEIAAVTLDEVSELIAFIDGV